MTESTVPLLDPLLERYLSELRIEGGLATNTLESYRRDLLRLQRYLRRHQLSIGDSVPPHTIRSFLSSLKQEALAAASIARLLSAMRGWYRFLVRENLVEINPLRDMTTVRRPVRLPRTLAHQEVTALLELPVRDRAEDQRDCVMVELLYAAGLRVSELIGLTLSQIDVQSGLCTSRRKRRQGTSRSDRTDCGQDVD